jgi:hypothetical protein
LFELAEDLQDAIEARISSGCSAERVFSIEAIGRYIVHYFRRRISEERNKKAAANNPVTSNTIDNTVGNDAQTGNDDKKIEPSTL